MASLGSVAESEMPITEPEPGASPLVQANSVMRALNLLGDRWTLLVLLCALLGLRRFDEFLKAIGLARSLLTNRLRRLEDAGILRRALYQERPARYEYRLTRKGIDLHDCALMMIRWERRWHFDPGSAAQRPVHYGCGREFTPELRCTACGGEPDVREVEATPGPGAGCDLPAGPRAQRRSILSEVPKRGLHPMLERAFLLMGDRWTAHVVAAAFYGARRFGDFETRLRIAPNILSDRLSRLVAGGILRKDVYQTRPERAEYRLTDQGRDLFPLIATLLAWGDKWLAGAKGPPLILRHKPCGALLVPHIICDQCGEGVDVRSIAVPQESVVASLASNRLSQP